MVRPEDRPFIGREAELASCRRLLEGGAAVVTVRGPSGIGKTRLALELAGRAAADHPGGTVLCELGRALGVADVAEAAARALGVELSPADPDAMLDRAGRALAHRGAVLVILDGCDAALEGAARAVSAFRDLAPEARFVATSRELLDLDGERSVELRPFEPDAGLALFRARGEATADEATVRDLVRRLEGSPLAIELTAAVSRTVPVDRMRERLGDTRGRRGRRRERPSRPSMLRTAVDGAWQLMSDAERAAFAQSAVFADGFTVEAADAVLALPGGAPVRETIEAVRARALLRDEPDGGRLVRFVSHALLRRYAAERLDESGEREATEARHARFFVDAAERCVAALRGSDPAPALEWLAAARDDVLEAVRRSRLTDPDLGARGAIALAAALEVQGSQPLRRAVLDEALAVGQDRRREALLRAARGDCGRVLGDHAGAGADLERALAAAREAGHQDGDSALLGEVLLVTAQVLHGRRPVIEVIGALDEACRCFEMAGRRSREGEAARLLGHVLLLGGELGKSEQALGRALGLAASSGDALLDARARVTLAAVAQERGDQRVAITLYDRAIERLVGWGLKRQAARASLDRALVKLERGLFPECAADLAWAHDALAESGDLYGEGLAAQALSTLALFERDFTRAEAWNEEAMRIYELLDHPWVLALLEAYRGVCAAATDRIEEARAAFEEARQRAAALGDPQALLTMIEPLRAFLDIAEARAAQAAGREGEAETAIEHARARRWLVSRAPSPESVAIRLLERLVSGAIDDARDGREPQGPGLLEVDPAGRWFRSPGGRRVDLSHRPRLVACLKLLVERRAAEPGRVVSREELLVALFPGERLLFAAGRNRVHVIVSALRRLGLVSVLLSRPGGFLLDPRVELRSQTS